jgi:hypothetical protein
MVRKPDKVLSSLLASIETRDTELRHSVVGSERLALLDLTRAIDSIGYLRAFAPGRKVSDLPGYVDISWLGAARALSMVSPNGMVGPGAAWSRPTPENSLWASATLYRAGLATHLNRLAGLIRHQLASLELSNSGALRFVITAGDLEAQDREAISWYAGHVRETAKPFLDRLRAEQGAWVGQELRRSVSEDPTFGIKYASSRDLESYFEAHAERRIAGLAGNDGLPPDSVIGPLTYGQFSQAVATGVARALKHSAFVKTLLSRGQRDTSRGILTVFEFDEALSEQWGDVLGLDAARMEVVMEMLGLSAADTKFLATTSDCPQALLVRGGNRCWHMPVFGGLHNPFSWLNRKLQRSFRRDWDKAVNAREALFREDLRRLFPEPRFFMADRPHVIRDGKRVLTDIDAVVVDRLSCTMAVFQLKWQDAFENSLAERASRQRNLVREGNDWIETVSRHCAGLDSKEHATRLGVNGELARQVREFRYFVLTRNGAQFSGGETKDRRAAWLSWYDLLKISHSVTKYHDPLSGIWKRGTNITKPKIYRGLQKFNVEGFDVEVIAV